MTGARSVFITGEWPTRDKGRIKQAKEILAHPANGYLLWPLCSRQIDQIQPMRRDVLKHAFLGEPNVRQGDRGDVRPRSIDLQDKSQNAFAVRTGRGSQNPGVAK